MTRPRISVVDVKVKAMTTGKRKAATSARKAARDAVIDECIDAARNEASQFLRREGAYVLNGPAGLAMALVAAIRVLKTLDPPRPPRRRKQP